MRMCCTALRWTCCSWAWRQMNAKMRWTPSRRRNAKWQCTCSWTILRILHSWGIIIQWKHPRNFWARSSVVACRQMQVVYWAAEAAAKVAPNTCQWHANYINKLLNQNGELKLHFWTERGDLRIGIQHSRYVDLQRRRTESVSSPKKTTQRCLGTSSVRPSGVPPCTLRGSRGLDLCPLQLAKFPLNAPKHTWRRASIKTAQRSQGVPEPSLPKKVREKKKYTTP
jgi:hypothetical protein